MESINALASTLVESYSMDAFSLTKLTWTQDTPGILANPFSIVAAQEAQVIPVTGRIILLACLISLDIFHKPSSLPHQARFYLATRDLAAPGFSLPG
jgi:hypothetical protein